VISFIPQFPYFSVG